MTKGSGILIQQAAATDALLLNFGRLVVGTASGLLCSPVGVYVAEVTTPTYRTSLGSIIRRAIALPYLQDERSNCMHALAIQTSSCVPSNSTHIMVYKGHLIRATLEAVCFLAKN